MRELTINDLARLANEQVAKGNGEKKVLVAGDDEGNDYHQLWTGFDDEFLSEMKNHPYPPYIPVAVGDYGEYIILS